ncbi:MAG: hypothetical protein LBU32_32805 [Clostridiales bacterium]|nr:hypothetical protein [Clostridiales bacterium]
MRPVNVALLQLVALRQCYSKVLHACNTVPTHQGCSAINRRVRSWSKRPGAPIYSWTAQLPSGSLG